ncbi:hypothetical protein PUN28_003844 [Cardiocondyla obscurior]|uniref:Transmembrane protein n=1 Tax=Cardiocondyla obscurior TaxID=286306 RepID=A0AAW2GKI8_9HYME
MPTKRDADGKREGAKERNGQVRRRYSLQKDTRGQREKENVKERKIKLLIFLSLQFISLYIYLFFYITGYFIKIFSVNYVRVVKYYSFYL